MSFIDILAAVLVSGSVSGSIGFSLGLGLRPGLKLRLETYAHGLIKSEVDNFVQNLNENPKFVQDLVGPFMEVIGKQLGMETGEGKEPKDLKIGGIKLPAWAIQLGLQLLTKGRGQPALPPGLEDLIPR
jgi:hypothetical protein